MKIFFAVLMVLTMASLSSAQTNNSPDVIFINGDALVLDFFGRERTRSHFGNERFLKNVNRDGRRIGFQTDGAARRID